MAHVWCCPRRAGAAGHHVCSRACSNTDFQHTKPYLTAETGVLPTWNAAARRAAARRCCVKLLRAAHVWDANVGDDRSVPKRWQWAAAHPARANRTMVSCTREFSHAQTLNHCLGFRRAACRANLHSGTVNGLNEYGAWNLSLSVFQATSHILCDFLTEQLQTKVKNADNDCSTSLNFSLMCCFVLFESVNLLCFLQRKRNTAHWPIRGKEDMPVGLKQYSTNLHII